jgi:hypothetical protein
MKTVPAYRQKQIFNLSLLQPNGIPGHSVPLATEFKAIRLPRLQNLCTFLFGSFREPEKL